ncbi:hypothetical protein SLS60_007902 [Paraconiothyrium brasiliense]|uniref:Uncharacterized protein n=1 Tax=Paraconiothyrium brasiliense TaxID=300254 RepID=A0ABR3R2U4_9PLEO
MSRDSTSAAAAAVNIKHEAAPQQPPRPQLSQQSSSASYSSDFSPSHRLRRQDEDNGMVVDALLGGHKD